ncbi:circadian-associated transcriptional repressor [Canis lupus familiaris]|uniref:Circadian associated repressor of transcription n=3 Tax=Canis lupus TaxID=9612 RepID=A0A8C0ME62_CANLF|nr:circadian-associated transcriptional repressor [Canis lupus familiaris]XP_005630803.1 circadian-associated transcriptional repressor [Canis lupus familiaris]XP_025308932.1 circadian-associated transcriptional repressor [Canis lupus dingo]XP_025308933.1 circadian-associated transcriptional repressor [Canis lupus dingo]XP_035556787.1 circadian-associated transcriptional repressor [Canis lupus dingo]XP_038278963.1 circadian-associated transcriptional repressor [Canis lupus familiaris]XP_03827|eukprot:XP_003639691.1 circadian-associated transcriptional repressor [Canis lupus familiaris]
MDSPASDYSCSSYSLSSCLSTSPVNSDFGLPSDSEGEDKGAHGPRSDPAGQRGGSRPSPGPIRCRQRTKVSSNQHTASHLEQRGLASPMVGSGVKKSRDGELQTNVNIQGCTTEGDLLFAQKCKELQGFIRPLTDLLNGLKMGRFERGLSSFQQSVAMDRIQRIVGILQKPQMGERYLGTLLQVEGMLKTWFPHIAAQKSSLSSSRHQLTKHFPSPHSYSAASSPAPPLEKMDKTQLGHLLLKPKQPWHLTEWPTMHLTWIHTTPICNPPLSSPGTISFSHGPLGTGASIGVILFVQHGMQPFTHSAPTTPVPPTTASPVIPVDPKKLSREGPHCHSLPATLPSDWSCTLSGPGLPTMAREMTMGHLEQMRSHPPVAPEVHSLNP